MQDRIQTIQDFLSRGELRLSRGQDQYRILSIDEWGKAMVYRNHDYTKRSLILTRKEITGLASLCFPPESSIDAALQPEHPQPGH